MKKKRREKTSKTSPTPPSIDLSNLESSRNAMAELIKQFYVRKIKDNRARTLAYLYQTYLAYLRAEAELDIMKRVQKLEEKIFEHRTGS